MEYKIKEELNDLGNLVFDNKPQIIFGEDDNVLGRIEGDKQFVESIISRMNGYEQIAEKLCKAQFRITQQYYITEILKSKFDKLYKAVDEMFRGICNEWEPYLQEEGKNADIEELVGDLRKVMYGE